MGYHTAQWWLTNDLSCRVIGVSRSENSAVKTLKRHKRFSHLAGSITNKKFLSKEMPRCDFVYHLASVSSERLALMNPAEALRTNVVSVIDMLEAVRSKKIKRFVFSSSAAVYPDSNRPKSESEAAAVERFYGMTKWMAEQYVRICGDHFKVPYTILRFSRLYGPYMVRNPIFDMSLGFLGGSKIYLYEGLDSIYDFLHARDAASALYTAQKERWLGQTVNIGSGEGISLRKLYKLFCERSGRNIPIEVKQNKISTDIVNTSKARSLGWSPQVNLEQGIEDLLDHMKKR